MAYSHTRLRNALALIRIAIGVLFLIIGQHKVASWEYPRTVFPQFLFDATHGAAVGFYGRLLDSFVWDHPSGYAVLTGFVELFLGVGLVLGLAVRPVALLGMMYTAHLMLATWMAPGPYASLWRYFDGQARNLALFALFLLFGVGHAGENWGVGALYHHRRHLRWEGGASGEEEAAPVPAAPEFAPDSQFDPDEQPHVWPTESHSKD